MGPGLASPSRHHQPDPFPPGYPFPFSCLRRDGESGRAQALPILPYLMLCDLMGPYMYRVQYLDRKIIVMAGFSAEFGTLLDTALRDSMDYTKFHAGGAVVFENFFRQSMDR